MWQLILKTEDAKTYIDSVVSEVRDEIAHVYREKYPTLESTDKKTFDRLVEDDVIAFEKACNILEEQGIDFKKGSEIVATELGSENYNIPTFTTIPGAEAAIKAIKALQSNKINTYSLQEIHNF